jgi:hypothetical protein
MNAEQSPDGDDKLLARWRHEAAPGIMPKRNHADRRSAHGSQEAISHHTHIASAPMPLHDIINATA